MPSWSESRSGGPPARRTSGFARSSTAAVDLGPSPPTGSRRTSPGVARPSTPTSPEPRTRPFAGSWIGCGPTRHPPRARSAQSGLLHDIRGNVWKHRRERHCVHRHDAQPSAERLVPAVDDRGQGAAISRHRCSRALINASGHSRTLRPHSEPELSRHSATKLGSADPCSDPVSHDSRWRERS